MPSDTKRLQEVFSHIRRIKEGTYPAVSGQDSGYRIEERPWQDMPDRSKLAILQDASVGPSGKPLLVEAYEREVIGGAGAFVAVAETRADFGRAIRRKMALEISGAPVPVQVGAAP